jgi:hypothetical protein
VSLPGVDQGRMGSNHPSSRIAKSFAALFRRLAAQAEDEPKVKSSSSSRPAQSLQPARSDT